MGPQIVGILSDLLNPMFGVETLRYVLPAVVPINIWAGVHYWPGGRYLSQDLNADFVVSFCLQLIFHKLFPQ
jgi:hypothetical protein